MHITPEHQIQNEIRVALTQHDCTCFRANVGKVFMSNGKFFDTGLPKGYPDLFGFRHSDGKIFFIEVKNEIGRLRPEQKTFRKFAANYPVLYGVARSANDAIKIIEGD
ncbi:VRR-NUC domain-containing protein [Apilactobacillus quenuiae]|uniref:VRR-NUC domain-containing protein n=1 Tax=Apilactobacillus quenuiae TaxID=2008377 RepID=UPI001CDABDE0|nr:VRR-NUC domain-containing protein [Apilactobacillus quenuiae]